MTRHYAGGMALYAHTHLGMPAPRHTLTEAAEAARVAVRQLPPSRLVEVITKSGVTMKTSRAPLTRREVEEAYVHPEPATPGGEVLYWWTIDTLPASASTFANKARAAGADVKVTVARGTTLPKWHVNAPDSKPNPGPPVDASQYHGDVVDSVVVWAKGGKMLRDGIHPLTYQVARVRAEWHNGRIHEVTVNGSKSSLKAALEALGATS